MSRILVIGDLHCPVEHRNYLKFCKDLHKKWKCNDVMFIGDVCDWHAISFHAHHPECPGPKDEYQLTLKCINKWYRAFPKAKVCVGNHDERPERLAATVNIPAEFLRSYSEIWKTPGWDWDYDFIIDDVYYFHGTGHGGINPAWNVSAKMGMSVVMGHCHSRAGVKWRTNPRSRTFAMDVGCGIDARAFQFAYGKHIKDRPALAAAVVDNGIPYHMIMPISKGEKYD